MNRFFITAFCLLCSIVLTFAQKKELKVKFGKISDKEIAMTTYEQDPGAPGVVLFDKADVSNSYNSNQGFVMIFERHFRFKVFKKEAFKLADLAIQHHNNTKVSDIKASSFNMENGVLIESKLEKANIFVEEISKNYRVTKFIVPVVKEGSIVDISYSWSSGGGAGMPGEWVFQRENVPTIWSEFKASVPSFIEFQKMSHGWVPFALTEESSGTDRINGNIEYTVSKMHFVQENVPALKPEEYVYSSKDYLSSINFNIGTVYEIDVIPAGQGYRVVNGIPTPYPNSWEVLGKELLEDVYEKIIKSSRSKDEAANQSAAGKTSVKEKLAAVYEYIGTNYQLESGRESIFMSQSMNDLVKQRKGSPTDLNLLFLNIAKNTGMQAHPVLISTTDHGKVYEFRVNLDYMNRVISAVMLEDSTYILVDAAAFPNPVGLLTAEDLGNQGLMMRAKDDIEWIPLQNKIADKSVVIANFTLDAEGNSKGSVVAYEAGYGGVEMRRAIKSQGNEQAIKSQFKSWLADGELSDLKLTNHDKWNESSVKMEFKMSTTALCNVAGDKIYLSPMLGLGLHENPFKNPARKFNIDLGPVGEAQYNLSFTIPAGYKVEEMPKPVKSFLGENALAYEYLTENNGTTIKINVKFKQKTDSVAVAEYTELQQFFIDMTTKLEQQIVLTKI
ncbi:MAG: hypothetical protein IPN76_16415 [Saprospiraceae bacterium]|nr:hypothetical protein [Saprospiraceae bacterium]